MGETSWTLWKNYSPLKPNISQEELRGIKELRKDSYRDILTADREVAMVFMNRKDYPDKVQHLLVDRETYRPITTDPISRPKIK